MLIACVLVAIGHLEATTASADDKTLQRDVVDQDVTPPDADGTPLPIREVRNQKESPDGKSPDLVRSDAGTNDADVDTESIQKWVQQLGHDNYRRREAAVKKLIKAGSGAVPHVSAAIDSGDLETTLSVINILREIALAQPPDRDSGAWSQLLKLSKNGTGSRMTRSAAAVEEIRDYRSGQAQEALSSAGVFIGHSDFVVRAISTQKPIVQIDENWNGDIKVLDWLRWLRGIEYARIKGPAIRGDVLGKLSKTVDLTTIAIVEGEIKPEMLQPLKSMSRILSLEFRYVDLDDSITKPIMELPIRVSLSLTGTGIPKPSVEALREALPGLQIDCKEGGFLGVTCQSAFNDCRIQSVMPGSAADKAGLIAMDVVVGIDDQKVNRFEDLQKAIGQHYPGDEVEVKFRRADREMSVTVKLGKLEDR